MKKTTLSIQDLFKLTVFMIFINLAGCNSGYQFPYQNPDLPTEERVNDLLSRMTLAEKASQMVYDAPAIERLGIPEYNWWNECLHGVARSGLATVFPQAIGMAAMFDTAQMHKVAVIISDEARAKYEEAVRNGNRGIYQGLTFWTPNINLFRDPRWGRGMETYGEDPFLTGELAVSFIKGLQGDDPHYLKVVATAKHFVVHSGPESSRHVFDARIGRRDFFESYAPHFKKSVEEANVQSVMCAYNSFDGEPCCGNGYLLNEVLRNDWGFKGYVVSDCWALTDFYMNHKVTATAEESAAMAIKSGTDLNCGSVYPSLIQAVDSGLVDSALINESVKRLFTARFKLGMFDPDDRVPYAQIPYSDLNSDAHKKEALITAQKSMVLLKNEGNILPLSKNLKTIAVIGPNANDDEVLLGNYNGFPEKAITPLQGIIDKVGGHTEVIYAQGCDVANGMPTVTTIPGEFLYVDADKTQQGLNAEYFDNTDFSGEPVLSRIDTVVDFNWEQNAPDTLLPKDNFGVRWTGYLVPEETGDYNIGGDGFDVFKIWIDDELWVDFQNVHHNVITTKEKHLEKGTMYKIRIEYENIQRAAMMKFIWSRSAAHLEKQALEAARKADVVILTMGLSPRLEGEEMSVKIDGFSGGDRMKLSLPAAQLDLMKKIKAVGKPMVLVLLNGSAVAINWESENIPAILESWYGGQAAGTAIADILFGDYNPAGRLPVTFYKSVDQLPDFEDYDMKGHTYRFFEGDPLYGFGYGLSYTHFTYSHLDVPESASFKGPFDVSVQVTNDGKMAGDEVVQLYIKDMEASVPVPRVALKGISRISLKPGETKTVSFTVTSDMLTVFSDEGCAFNEPGMFEISIGGKQPYQKGYDAQTTQVVSKTIELSE